MQRFDIDGATLEVDFGGLVSEKEETIFILRCSGKNNEAIALVTGTKPDTVNKQSQSLFKKTGVKGFDNPMAALQTKAFLNRWARFLVLSLACGTSLFGGGRTTVRPPASRPLFTLSIRNAGVAIV